MQEVTIIIPVHNIAKRGLERVYYSLLSLSKQTIPIRAIVVDSSNPKAYKELNEGIKHFDFCQHIPTKEREFNLCRLFNKGIHLSGTPWIATTGADFLFAPDFFEAMQARQDKDTLLLKQVRSLAMTDPITFDTVTNWTFPERDFTYNGSKDACGGIQYAHIDLWKEINGYDNRMAFWGGMDEDIRNRATKYKAVHWVKESIFFHMPHIQEKLKTTFHIKQAKKNWKIKDAPRPRSIADGLAQIVKTDIINGKIRI